MLLLAGTANLLGYFAVRLRQPKVIGEILAGVLLGPALLGRLGPVARLFAEVRQEGHVLDLLSALGLLLLMFLSGAEIQQLFGREERREVACLTVVGTGLPFALGLLAAPFCYRAALIGPRANPLSFLLVLAASVAVTSVPVISKIFADLGLLGTRFARLVLSVAVLEDLVLWLALAVAVSTAGHAQLQPAVLSRHLLLTALFFVVGLAVVPRLVRALCRTRAQNFVRHTAAGWAIAFLLAYSVAAGALEITIIFGAFLAGIALSDPSGTGVTQPCSISELFGESLGAIGKFSFGFLIPIYFALVGLRLDLLRGFSWRITLLFLAATCTVKILSVALAGRLAGFRRWELIHLAVATNARGGPGIVLASVALDAGLISPMFYTTLVVTAVLTSEMAGVWLGWTQRRGWALLGEQRAVASV